MYHGPRLEGSKNTLIIRAQTKVMGKMHGEKGNVLGLDFGTTESCMAKAGVFSDLSMDKYLYLTLLLHIRFWAPCIVK